MARLPRVVVADVAHHVTQRGNARQFLLATGCERKEEKLVYRPTSVPGFPVPGFPDDLHDSTGT
jgi:hypothetical protein